LKGKEVIIGIGIVIYVLSSYLLFWWVSVQDAKQTGEKVIDTLTPAHIFAGKMGAK
jgi:hypothetical protein